MGLLFAHVSIVLHNECNYCARMSYYCIRITWWDEPGETEIYLDLSVGLLYDIVGWVIGPLKISSQTDP